MITFIDYQYKGIGGVGQLIVNVTLELNRRGLKCKAYCSKESFEYRRLADLSADFIHIDSDKVGIDEFKPYLDADDVIVLTHVFNTQLLENIKELNNRVIFYSVHPQVFFNYNRWMDRLCNQKKHAIELVDLLYRNHALYIMDGPNLKALTDCGWHPESVDWLPVPVNNYTGESSKFLQAQPLHITYLGRGNEDYKIYPLIKVLQDLNQSDTDCRLSIITDTNERFIELIKELVPGNRIAVDYLSNLQGEALDAYLLEQSSLHIAMGTSALEGAKMGIPSILIDWSEEEFPSNYRYRWLYECDDYCLGAQIINGELPYDNGTTLADKIKEISTLQGFKAVSDSCREYVEKNHSIRSFTDTLLEADKRTTMTCRMYCRTRFSRNMKNIRPVILKIGEIKRFILRQNKQ